MAEALLSIRGLSKTFMSDRGPVYAVREVDLGIERGSIVGLVGESGSGKTTLGRTLLRLIEPTAGTILFDGTELNGLGRAAMRRMRRRMQIIFQDPIASLNPRLRVQAIVAEGLIAHGIGHRRSRRDEVAALLEEVGLKPDDMSRFPHEFSGGQRQRIGIARALALDPEFIVADESVSALDVSIQAQVLNLLLDIRNRRGLTMLFIAHDLAVVEYLCDVTAVMYLGRLVEVGESEQLYARPAHPYTRALLSAIPQPEPGAVGTRQVLRGDIPSPLKPPSGCAFRTRCPYATAECADAVPAFEDGAGGTRAACFRLSEVHADDGFG